MFTKQYYTAMKVNFTGGTDGSLNTFKVKNALDDETYGVAYYSSFASSVLPRSSNITDILTSLSLSSVGFALGDGTVPPTVDDYKLSGNLITTLIQPTYGSPYCSNEGETSYWCVDLTLKNNGSDTVTVSEIAWFQPMRRAGTNNNILCMFDRTLLPNPVTIQPGETGNITYKLGITLPT